MSMEDIKLTRCCGLRIRSGSTSCASGTHRHVTANRYVITNLSERMLVDSSPNSSDTSNISFIIGIKVEYLPVVAIGDVIVAQVIFVIIKW